MDQCWLDRPPLQQASPSKQDTIRVSGVGVGVGVAGHV
jgi:hypothetical protein